MGDSFGRKISDKPYSKRTEFFCEDDCILGYLETKDYRNILEAEEERLLLRRCKRLRRYKVLERCSNEELKYLYENMTSLRLTKRQTLFLESDHDTSFIYFFSKGSITVVLSMRKLSPIYLNSFPYTGKKKSHFCIKRIGMSFDSLGEDVNFNTKTS